MGDRVSGFAAGLFGLTTTKALYWHRFAADECGCVDLSGVVARHVVPAGFRVVRWTPGSRAAYLSGPGISSGSTDELYRAVSRPPA